VQDVASSKHVVQYKTTKDPSFAQFEDANNKSEPGKPSIDEDDQIHVLARGLTNVKGCKTKEEESRQPPAVKVYAFKKKTIPDKDKNNFLASMGFKEDEANKIPTVGFDYCYLDVRYKGATKITYQFFKTETKDGKDEQVTLFEDNVQVRELYHFRVLAGPVYSNLINKNKNYSLVTNDSSGSKAVSGSVRQDTPVNYALFLKGYWKARDVLEDIPWEWKKWHRFFERINPVIEVNLMNPNPLENFYAGLSFEPFRGIDITTGLHRTKLRQLTGQFGEGLSATQEPATRERFVNGWFLGVAVDIGVLGTWLSNIWQAIPPAS